MKTRQTLFTPHAPYVVAGRAPLLFRMFDLFNTTVGFTDGMPVFHRWVPRVTPRVTVPRARSRRLIPARMSRDWLSHQVRKWEPLCSPHSLRVGCATEAWAAGIPLPQIQALGRWQSVAALLYIIGSLDETAAVTVALGSGSLHMTADGRASIASARRRVQHP